MQSSSIIVDGRELCRGKGSLWIGYFFFFFFLLWSDGKESVVISDSVSSFIKRAKIVVVMTRYCAYKLRGRNFFHRKVGLMRHFFRRV